MAANRAERAEPSQDIPSTADGASNSAPRAGDSIRLGHGGQRFNPRSGYSWLILIAVLALAAYEYWQRTQNPVAPSSLPGLQKPPVVFAPPTSDQSRDPASTAKSTSAAPSELDGEYRVIRVADGDTFTVVDEKDREHRVRMIGIDSPEIDHPDQGIKAEPQGYEARMFAVRMVHKRPVRLAFDPGYERTDRYGRWLCFVYFQAERGGPEKLLNEEVVRNGYAIVYDDRRRFPFDPAAYRRLKTAQAEARGQKRGIYAGAN